MGSKEASCGKCGRFLLGREKASCWEVRKLFSGERCSCSVGSDTIIGWEVMQINTTTKIGFGQKN